MIRTFAVLTMLFASISANAAEWSLASPDKSVSIEVRQSGDQAPQYRVLYHKDGKVTTALDWSPLGLVVDIPENFTLDVKTSDFTKSVAYESKKTRAGRDRYHMTTGKRRDNDDAYRELSLTFHNVETKLKLAIDFRAYAHGAAFRYRLPEASIHAYRMVSEATGFNVGEGGTHLGAPYDFYTMYNPSYETLYEPHPTGTATPKDAGTGWAFPSLFTIRGLHLLIHETDVGRDDRGSHLQPEAPKGVYRVASPLAEEARGLYAVEPYSTLPWAMPWRMIIVSDDYADIVENNLVFDLATPAVVAEAPWMQPGVATWNWLSDHDSGTDQKKLKAFIDLAADMGVPYTLIDTNWNLSGKHPMETLVDYAKKRGVGLLFWYNSGGRHNVVNEQPKNRLDDPRRRREEFAKLKKLGVRGIKVDFLQSDKQDIIALYHDIIRDAADYGLMVNFHGCTIPRGWQRTYPNLMSMEAVRGAEFYSFGSTPPYGDVAPGQNTTHPFLRNVIGSMDYTPVHFSQFYAPRKTSNAHEAALPVIFETGLLHLSDSVAAYRALPQGWRDYLATVPTVWDETRLLAGAPGDYVVLARRNGERWYIAGINGKAEPRDVAIDLNTLKNPPARFTMLDDSGADGFGEHDAAPEGGVLKVSLGAYGGFVAFTPHP